MLRPPEEFNRLHRSLEISAPNVESISNNMTRTKILKRKLETNDLTRFGNLPMSSGQKGEDIIQTNRVVRVTNRSENPN